MRKYDWNFQPGRDILKHVCAILNDWGIESIVFAVIHPAGPDPGAWRSSCPSPAPAIWPLRSTSWARRGVPATPDFFDVLLHLGTLVAVFAAYWQDIRDMIVELIDGVRDLVRGTTPNPIPPARRMILLIIVGTLPLFVVLPVKDLVEGLSGNIYFVAGALIVTGFLLFASDRVKKGRKTERSASCWMCCWWALPRPSLPARHLPLRHHYHRPAALWALTGSLRCAFLPCCPSLPSWGPTS